MGFAVSNPNRRSSKQAMGHCCDRRREGLAVADQISTISAGLKLPISHQSSLDGPPCNRPRPPTPSSEACLAQRCPDLRPQPSPRGAASSLDPQSFVPPSCCCRHVRAACRRAPVGGRSHDSRQVVAARSLPAAVDSAGDGHRPAAGTPLSLAAGGSRCGEAGADLPADRPGLAVDDGAGPRQGPLRGVGPRPQAWWPAAPLSAAGVGRGAAADVQPRLVVPGRSAGAAHGCDSDRHRPLHRHGADLDRPGRR